MKFPSPLPHVVLGQNQERILQLFFYTKKPLMVKEIQEILGKSYFSTWRSLNYLLKNGLVKKTSANPTKYCMSPFGFQECINRGIGL